MKAMLQLAESGSFLGQVDLFKVRGKFALTDAYEDHFALPKGRIIMVTHRRVLLMQVSISIGEHWFDGSVLWIIILQAYRILAGQYCMGLYHTVL